MRYLATELCASPQIRTSSGMVVDKASSNQRECGEIVKGFADSMVVGSEHGHNLALNGSSLGSSLRLQPIMPVLSWQGYENEALGSQGKCSESNNNNSEKDSSVAVTRHNFGDELFPKRNQF